jgi:RND family efflux transporter MFP subunit
MKIKTGIVNFLIPAIFLSSCAGKKSTPDPASVPATVSQIQLAAVHRGGVRETLRLPAQLAAYEQVSIFPRVNGYVQSVLVDVGSQVKTGQLLMDLEAPELEQAAAQARERYARAKSEFVIDREDYGRIKEAALTPGAISPQDLASSRAKMDADSSLANAEKANWDMQETMRSYLRVRAPFSGVITERNVHPGALVSAEAKDSKPMLELKQISHLRLEVDIPEALSSSLREGDTVSFYLNAFPGKKMQSRVSRISMNINLQFRSERIELDVYNADHQLAPGMYAEVIFSSRGNPLAFVVPKSAVVTSTERKYVLVDRDGKLKKVDVSTGNESAGTLEAFGPLRDGEQVVVKADDEMREGQAVP